MVSEEDNRPSVYYDESVEKWVYRFSSLGSCIQALVAERSGEIPTFTNYPAWLLERFEEGRSAEDTLINIFQGRTEAPGGGVSTWTPEWGGWRILPLDDPKSLAGVGEYVVGVEYGQWNCEIPVGDEVVIRGKLDGLGKLYALPVELGEKYHWQAGLTKCVVEVKFFGSDYWAKFKKEGIDGFPYYATQVSLQMAATGLPCAFLLGLKGEPDAEKGDGKPTVKDVAVTWFTQPPIELSALKAKVARVESLIYENEYPKCDYKMWPCKFLHLHSEEERQEVLELDDVELEELSRLYTEGKEQESSGSEIKKDASKKLLELIDEKGYTGKKMTSGQWEVTDTSFKKDGYEVKPSVVRYPNVKIKKEKSSGKEKQTKRKGSGDEKGTKSE